MIVAASYLCIVAVIGFGITHSSGVAMSFEERVGVGVVVGVVVATIAAFLVGWMIGFGATAVAVGAVAASAASVHGWSIGARIVRRDAADLGQRLRLPWRSPGSARAAAALTVGSGVLAMKILAAGYRTTADGALAAGHLSTYGDWNAHLAYAGSFSNGANYPPTSPLASGAPLAYHVLVDVFGASATVLGTPPTAALCMTSGMLALAFPLVFLFAARRLCGGEGVALVAYVLFTLCGGLGFVAIFGDIGEQGISALIHPTRSYARMTEHGIWFDNPVLSYLYAQRPGLIGLPVVLIAAAVSFERREAEGDRAWLALGLLIGASTAFSVYGATMALGLAGWSALRARRGRRALLLPALASMIPVVVLLRPETTHVRWLVGWMAPGADVPWVWFWVINTGILVPIALLALIRSDALRTGSDLWFAVPVWSTFVAMNFVVLQPWEWNNSHYLIVWLMMLCFPVAGLLVAMARSRIAVVRVGALALGIIGIASGALDIWGATGAATFEAQLTTADGAAAAEWARHHTDADAVFAVAPVNTQPMLSLGARRVISGHPGWTFDLGVADWAQRVTDAEEILADGPRTDELIDRYGVDYVVAGDDERALPNGVAEAHWAEVGDLVYENDTYRIYRITG